MWCSNIDHVWKTLLVIFSLFKYVTQCWCYILHQEWLFGNSSKYKVIDLSSFSDVVIERVETKNINVDEDDALPSTSGTARHEVKKI